MNETLKNVNRSFLGFYQVQNLLRRITVVIPQQELQGMFYSEELPTAATRQSL